MTGVSLAVLGRISITTPVGEALVRGGRERAVLAALVAARGEVVPADRLVTEVWGDDAGSRGHAALLVAVSHLRSQLEPTRPPRTTSQVLVRACAGYSLRLPDGSVDAEVFSAHVAEAYAASRAGDDAAVVDRCDEAAALWSGPPFAGASGRDLVDLESTRLEGLRMTALELRAQSLLHLGRHSLLVGELEALVAAHPMRERLLELHAVALYRCGRQAEALAALRRGRSVLADELGVDPSPQLQQLELDILVHAPHLLLPPAATGPRSASGNRCGRKARPTRTATRPAHVRVA
ncbi:AfsR/SARP family transcriptional regulator [Motilibacter peucedani]|uniref:AfsR/SARP family transcriptional regulator n=1 Tax=Motilibacter peucedani TaxID=598650 RepID=UPI0016025A74|nr:AfsR/SARP family transcriptional regulator [Motilibacter peucedani]